MKKYNRPCVYVIVRKDMRMRDIIVQSCHAALESGIHETHCEEYDSALVVLEVKNEEALKEANQYIKRKGIACRLFWEGPMNSYTALATEAINQEQRKIFKKFKLLSTHRETWWKRLKRRFKWIKFQKSYT